MNKTANSPYRWVILLAIVPIIVSTEVMWLSLAPISSLAEKFYGVDSLYIALFSMSYMIMFILFSLPVSFIIDKFGFRVSLIIGALITAVFGLSRAVFYQNFEIVLISQFALAIGQPFLLNISTKVPANWFPQNERATAAGILTMAQYLGFAIPMLLAPILAEKVGIGGTFLYFGIFAAVAALMAILLTKEHPAVRPLGPTVEKETLTLASLKKLAKNPQYILVLIICFISIGAFNTILSLVETIFMPRGMTSMEAGLAGAIFVVAGIFGAIILPIISDWMRVRVPFFIGAISSLVPLYLCLTFLNGFIPIMIFSGITGFIIMGVAPILFQYGSEAAYPISEGTSLGIILLMGQLSGVLFVLIFETFTGMTDSVTYPMLMLVLLTLLEVPLTLRMKESASIKQSL